MVNAEIALSRMRKSDGSPAPGYPEVKIVVLWDGEGGKLARSYGNRRIHPDAGIYELGAMDDETYEGLAVKKTTTWWTLSKNAKDLTSSAPWLPKEPDMGDVNTLSNFLEWANKRYAAQNVVLILSDHGGGTEWETESGGIGNKIMSSRSLCWDDSSSVPRALTASDIKNAIEASGLSVNIIWMDCCLQGSVENTYLLRGSADYLLTSQNVSYAHNYYDAFLRLKRGYSAYNFGTELVAEYANYYKGCTEPYTERSRSSFDTAFTQALYSLDSSKQQALYDAIENLSEELLSFDRAEVEGIYAEFLKQNPYNISDCKGMAYEGTYSFMNDIGHFCQSLIEDDFWGSQPKLKAAAEAVEHALDEIVLSAWVGKTGKGVCNYSIYLNNNYSETSPLIWYCKNVSGVTERAACSESDYKIGLSIGTQLSVPSSDDYLRNTKFWEFYSNYSGVTGYSQKWGELMKVWHP